MALQNFVDKVGPVVSAAWLNVVDGLKFTIFGDAATKAAARTALTSDLPLEIVNGGTAARTAANARTALTADAPLEVANGGTGTRGSGASFLTFLASFFPSIWQYANPQTAAEAAASLVPTNYAYLPGNFLRYGCDPTGVTAIDTLLAGMVQLGIPLYAPKGTYLIQASHAVLAGHKLTGDGIGVTIIHVKNSGATLNGFTCNVSHVEFEELEVDVDVNGQTGCNFLALSGTVDDLRINKVLIKGVSTKLNNWGIYAGSATVTNWRMDEVLFDTLDLPVWKANADTGSVSKFSFMNCGAYNCTDVFEMNAPSSFWRDGTISGFQCSFIHQFPFGMANCQRIAILGVQATDCDAEVVHIEDGCDGINISGLETVRTNLQSAGNVGAVAIISTGIGARTSQNITVEDFSIDCTQNLTGVPQGITVQAGGSGSTPYKVSIGFGTIKCALVPTPAWSGATAYVPGNTVLSGGIKYACILAHTNHVPPNATYWAAFTQNAVLASSSAQVDISHVTFDNPNYGAAAWSGATPYVVGNVVASGGNFYQCILGHTNQVPPNATYWVQVLGGQIPWFLDISNSRIAGEKNKFLSPAIIAHIDDNSYGTLDDSVIDATGTGDLLNWTAWLSGNTSTISSITFNGVQVHCPFTSNAAATPNSILPVTSTAILGIGSTIALTFRQNGVTAAFVQTGQLTISGGAATASNLLNQAAGSTPAPTTGQYTIGGGYLQIASTGGATFVGQCQLEIKGPMFP